MAPSRVVARVDDDFVPTIYDEDLAEDEEEIVQSDEDEPQTNGKKRKRDGAPQQQPKKRQKGVSATPDEALKQAIDTGDLLSLIHI